jgi:hypothetical protein
MDVRTALGGSKVCERPVACKVMGLPVGAAAPSSRVTVVRPRARSDPDRLRGLGGTGRGRPRAVHRLADQLPTPTDPVRHPPPGVPTRGLSESSLCGRSAPALNGRGRLPHIWLAAMLVHVVVGRGYRGLQGPDGLATTQPGPGTRRTQDSRDRHDSFGSERGRRRRSAAVGPGGADLQRSIHPGNQLATASPGEGRSWGPNVRYGVAYLLWSLVQDVGTGIRLVLTRFPGWRLTNWGVMTPRRCSPPTGSPT